jgi:hypothetical protein
MRKEPERLLQSKDGKCPHCKSEKTEYVSPFTNVRPSSSNRLPKSSKLFDKWQCKDDLCKKPFLYKKG